MRSAATTRCATRLDTSSGPDDVLREAGWPAAGDNVIVVGHQPTLGQVAAQPAGRRWATSRCARAPSGGSPRAQREGGDETVLKAVLNPELLEN